MDFFNGLFVWVGVILVLVGIILGFLMCNSIRRNNEQTQQETANGDVQLNRIEREVRRAATNSMHLSWISLSVAAIAVGGAGLEIPNWGRFLLVGCCQSAKWDTF